MNLTPRWVQFLREAGYEAVHWSDVGDFRAADSVLFDYARASAMVVFTHDLDFGVLLAKSRAVGPSVIQVRAIDTRPEAIGALVLAALSQHMEDLKTGSLLTIDSTKSRIRVLPIC